MSDSERLRWAEMAYKQAEAFRSSKLETEITKWRSTANGQRTGTELYSDLCQTMSSYIGIEMYDFAGLLRRRGMNGGFPVDELWSRFFNCAEAMRLRWKAELQPLLSEEEIENAWSRFIKTPEWWLSTYDAKFSDEGVWPFLGKHDMNPSGT